MWAFAWMPALAAFAVALVLIVASAALWMRHSAREQTLAELLDLHVATMASANPVDVISTDRHTVKPWFQGKLPFTFNLPELQNSPFKLVGGRVDVFQAQPGRPAFVRTSQSPDVCLYSARPAGSDSAGDRARLWPERWRLTSKPGAKADYATW